MRYFAKSSRAFLEKVVYTITIASTVLWTLGSAAMPFPAQAAVTTLTAVATAGSPQAIAPSSAPTAVLGLNMVGDAGEHLNDFPLVVNPGSGFTLSDLATIGTTGASGIALYQGNGATHGTFDGTNTNIALTGAPVILDGTQRYGKLLASATSAVGGSGNTITNGMTLAVGDFVFAKTTAGSGSLNSYAWHIVTVAETIGAGVAPSTLRLDGNGSAPTFTASSQISKFTPAATGSFVVSGTPGTTITQTGTYTTPAVGDIVFYQKDTAAGQWGLVTNATLTNGSGTFAVDGTTLVSGAYRISNIAGATGTGVVSGSSAITLTNGLTLAAGDIVLYKGSGGSSGWGVVTNATLTSGTFNIDGMQSGLSPDTYRFTKITAYTPASFIPGTTPITAGAINQGDLIFGLPTQNPTSILFGTTQPGFDWHITTGDPSGSAANYRLDGQSGGAPVFGFALLDVAPVTPIVVPADDAGSNAGADMFIVARTSSGAINGHAFTVGVVPNTFFFNEVPPSSPAATVSATYTITGGGGGPTPPTITSVTGFPGQNALTVHFSKPVQKISAGGNITFTSGSDPFVYTDGGGTAQTITAVSHVAGQDFATLTMSGVLDAQDFGAPGTLHAASNKIEDMSGTVLGTASVNLTSPLAITTTNIQGTYVGAVYTSDSPLVAFAAAGGTPGYSFTPNAQFDTDALTALGLTLATNGKITGTVASVTGSRTIAVKVTDSTGGTPLTMVKPFTINVASSQGAGVAGLSSINPPVGVQGASNLSLTITGVNTNFTSSSTVSFLFPPGQSGTNGVTVGTVTANSATSLAVHITAISGSATVGARDVIVTTGSQVVSMPSGFNVVAAAGAGLNLVFPTDGATNVALPRPGFNFSPSTNATFTNYRLTVSTTQNFATGTMVWDYAFPKTSALCASSCNVSYGDGQFLTLTQPMPLAPNTTYYWRVQTYSGTLIQADVTNLSNKLDDPTPLGFTTAGSITDTQPPQIQHRAIYEARANAALTLFARAVDNVATPTSSPALTATLYACNGSSCTLPATSILPGDSATDGVVAGTSIGSGYFSFTIPVEVIGASVGTIRYYIGASDGTNTANFKQPDGTPFQFTTTAVPGSPASIGGTVKDSTGTCSVAVRQAVVFAEGTGFNTTSSNDSNCTYTLGGLSVGSPYTLVAVKDGFSDRRAEGIPSGTATPVPFQLGQGAVGGFGGDTSKPQVRFTAPNNGMAGLPGADSSFQILIAFNKTLSQTSVTTASNITIKELNVQTGSLGSDIATTKGAWTYNATFVMPDGHSETNVAKWALSDSNTLGDNKTFAVTVTPNVTDTSGNAVQGNQSDGSFSFTFSTSGTANFATFNGGTNTFSNGDVFGAGNAIPPHVVGSTPPPGAFEVPRNSKILINFDKPMADDGSVYALLSNIKLFVVSSDGTTETDVSSSALNTATLSSDKQIAQVSLQSSYNTGLFASSTKYRLKVLGGAKGATGLTLAPPTQSSQAMFISEFRTSSTSDSAAPTVTGSFPNAGATNVAVPIGAISVSFSKDIDPSTVTSSTLKLSAGSTDVSGTVEYRPVEHMAYFYPGSSLTPNTQYTLTVTTGVTGLNGVALGADVTRSFTTGSSDTGAPKISFMNADDTNLAITFSKPMNAATATDSFNFSTSVLKAANYTIKYGATGSSSTGTALTIPSSATFVYDAVTNTLSIKGYHASNITADTLRNQELYVLVANVTDLGGAAIGGSNSAKSPIQNSGTTQGALGPMTAAGGNSTFGDFRPANFSANTFGFAPQAEVHPFNMMAGQTSNYIVRIPLSQQIPSGGSVVLTFPVGFDVSAAQQDTNSPKRRDINGPGTGAPTFKCLINVTTATGKSCGGTANADDADSAQGGLADDGVVVNANARTVTIYIYGGTRSENGDTHDFLDFDLAGIKNSTSPKDFNTSGYTVDIKTLNGSTLLESVTSQPFFIQAGGSNTINGTITATGNSQSGTMKVYLDSPTTGPLQATSTDFGGTATATYTFSNVPNGNYFLRTDPMVSIGSSDYVGKFPPEQLSVTGNVTKNFTITSISSGGTAVTVSVDGPSAEQIDIFASSQGQAGQAPQFRKIKKTLDSTPGAESFTITLPDGDWSLGVGPQMPDGPTASAMQAPSYIPPQPKRVTVSNPTCRINGAATCTATFVLTTSTKTIQGLVQDASGKLLTNVDVYGYSPSSGAATHSITDSKGAFILNVVDGLYNVGAMIPGMPPTKEVSVEVTGDAAIYLKINGSTTAITPAAAATAFIIKISKPDLSISGKVTDGTNVIQGASVYAYRPGFPGNASAVTDSSGNYTLYAGAGTWKVGVQLPGYGNLAEQNVILATSNATDVDFSPTATGTFYTVSGTVSAGGSGVQGAFVNIRGTNYFNSTTTASDGTYLFKVPAGTGYVIDGFIANVGQLAPLPAFTVATDTVGKNLTIANVRTITITLSSTITRAFVELRSVTGSVIHKDIQNASSATMSAPDGSYMTRIDLIGAQIPFTSVAATSGATIYDNTTGVMTVDGNEGLTVTVPTLRSITFSVKDGSNANVADAWVEVTNPTTGEHFGDKTPSGSGTTGQVTLKVSDGSYFVNAMKPGLVRDATSLTIDVSTPAQTLTMASATRTISGTILIGGTGAANAFIRAQKQGGGFAGAQADANGQYTLSVAPGSWSVFAIAEGYAQAQFSSAVDTSSASVSSVNITLTQTVSLTAPKSQSITPSTGGTLEDSNTGVKLTIPANALGTSSSAGNIQAKKTNNVTQTATGRPVAGLEITATDSNGTPIKTLNDNVTVELSYTKVELATIASSTDSSINTKTEVEEMSIGFWDESVQNWTTIPTTITYYDSTGTILTNPAEDLSNVTSVKLSGITNHFSLYAPLVATDPSAPSTPSGLSVGSATTSTLALSWTTVSGATSYDIYRSTTSGGTYTRLGSEPTVSSGSTTTYSDTGLTASTTYYYKITALNNSGESSASSAVFGTTSSISSGGGGGGGGGTVYVPSPIASSSSQNQATTQQQTTQGKTFGSAIKSIGEGVFEINIPATSATPATPALSAMPATPSISPAIPATPAVSATPAIAAQKLVNSIVAAKITAMPSFTRYLAQGARGKDVEALQLILQANSYYKGKVTGILNADTVKAVKKFQEVAKIATAKTVGYGNIGLKTRAFLNSLVKEAKTRVKQLQQQGKSTTPPQGSKSVASLTELKGLSEKDLWRDPVSKSIYILKK